MLQNVIRGIGLTGPCEHGNEPSGSIRGKLNSENACYHSVQDL